LVREVREWEVAHGSVMGARGSVALEVQARACGGMWDRLAWSVVGLFGSGDGPLYNYSLE
jgi:hypothetical protein